MERIEIYTSKKKSILLLLGSILFVALCSFVAFGILDISLYKRLVGIVGIAFFGLGIYVAIRQLIQNRLLLVIDDMGINVNPLKSDEKILWKHINGFPIVSISGTKIILIQVNNPQYWIDKETNKIRKKLMEFNYGEYGSLFNLSSNSMQIKHKELVDLLNNRLLAYWQETLNSKK